MAEPTEQEQLKTNQHLTKIENATAETSGKIDDLISAVKQPATYETDLLREIKDQGEEQAQTDKKTLKSQKAFHEDVKELTKNSATEKDHNKFMETIEKKKLGLQEATFKDRKRKDKFKTREDSKFLKWTERKWDGLKKTTDSWLSNLGKLLGLLAAFGILTWLKGKNLRKLWEDFLKVIDDWEKILPEWVKNLTIPETIKTGIAAVGAAFAAWSASLKLAASSFRSLGTGLERWFGIDAPFTKRLAELDLQVAKLTKKQAALQRAIKFASNLDDVSDLSAKLKLTNEALDLAKAEVSAVSRAKDLANALSDEAALAKKLRDANLELLKAEDAKAVAQRAFDLGSDLAPDSPLAKKLASASDELARATKQASVADEAARLARETTKTAQRAADVAAASTRPPGLPGKAGTPYQKMMGRTKRWWVEIDGKQIMISAKQAEELGANITGIDASKQNIEIAKLHAKKNSLRINYICTSPENLKDNIKFDVILNMEIVEHVEDINFFLESCSKLLKKNGIMFVATINRTLKSYLFAIIGAEYILRWLPIGTHDWEKFVPPDELIRIQDKNNLKLENLVGMKFNLIKNEWKISNDQSINYIGKFIKN